MMKSSWKIIFSIIVVSLFLACRGEQRILAVEEAAEKVFEDAFDALQNHDYDSYMSSLDFGTELDSLQEYSFLKAIQQHQDWQEKVKGTVAQMNVVDVVMDEDSICTLFYNITYADSTSYTSSQIMVCKNNVWKIRIRN